MFDGPEDRNGLRNHDEIRLFAEYLTGSPDWLVDDDGQSGGLDLDAAFVVMGDMNADPTDGDTVQGAIQQLLEHPRVHPDTATGSMLPTSPGGAENGAVVFGDPAHHTAGWGLRVDYVLPSANMSPTGAGVYWPADGEPGAERVSFSQSDGNASSDHRLVWVDVALPGP